jgi:hypothetical protein
VVFAPTLGHIPPDSGGWHRDLFSGSVAGAPIARPLLILLASSYMNPGSCNGTKVPMVLLIRIVEVKPEQESE